MQVIIYESNTGFTKQYAEILSKETGLPLYTLKEARGKVHKKEEVIFMSWIMAGSLQKYKKANRKYNVKVVCAVGMGDNKNEQIMKIRQRYKISRQEVFYAQGGINKTKLKGMHKFIINKLCELKKTEIENQENPSQKDKTMLEILENNKNCVQKENITEMVEFIIKN